MALALRQDDDVLKYRPLPTLRRFHESPAQIRCIVGPMGSGKTVAASWEIGYYLPNYILKTFGKKKTTWVVVRNSYRELRDTTFKTLTAWFPWGDERKADFEYTIPYPNGMVVELLFRACDNPQHVKKFKSLEVHGYWIDESIEVADAVRLMLKSRIGRFSDNRNKIPAKWGIETTNPPDVEHPTYSNFAWNTPPPGPIPKGRPIENHAGFWQPPYENKDNLQAGYYDDLRDFYRDTPDWADMYILGKPGVLVRGKLVYANFKREYHVAKTPLKWSGSGTIYRGWDNSGNTPACLVGYLPTAGQIHILKEFHTDRLGIVDFTNNVVHQCNVLYPGAKYADYADPAGEATFSKRGGGFTSNAELMRECGVDTKAADQNPTARITAVDQQLSKIDAVLIDPECVRLINGFLGGYCYPETRSGEFGSGPIKNRFSHIHDAAQYLFVSLFSNQSKKPVGKPYKPPSSARLSGGRIL